MEHSIHLIDGNSGSTMTPTSGEKAGQRACKVAIPRAFVGLKGPIELAKSPQRIYFFSGLSMQLLLILGQIAFVQGFTTLRAVSLCVVDAFFTSDNDTNDINILNYSLSIYTRYGTRKKAIAIFSLARLLVVSGHTATLTGWQSLLSKQHIGMTVEQVIHLLLRECCLGWPLFQPPHSFLDGDKH